MAKLLPTTAVIVTCLAHSGYRRAGVGLAKGENRFEADTFTEAQLAQLSADPRLKVVAADAGETQADTSTLSQGTLASATVDGGVSTGMSFSDAIAKLNPDDKAHFTGAGKPQCDALSELMGKSVTASERDGLWTEHLAAKQSESEAE
ncbi:HI1506-related protein [Shewanella algae]|uniref:HI1506-related protein n=1 Tax=Shewanella algae TaxID=38313 RepID=UPI00399974E1